MHGWCMSGVMCYVNECMYEWMNEWWINERVGNVEWLCILLYFICICNMSFLSFHGYFDIRRINPIYTPGQVLVISSHRTRLVTLAPNEGPQETWHQLPVQDQTYATWQWHSPGTSNCDLQHLQLESHVTGDVFPTSASDTKTEWWSWPLPQYLEEPDNVLICLFSTFPS